MREGVTGKIQKIINGLIYVLVGLMAILKGAVYYPDSYAFLDMRFNRSPFYCSFLKIMTSIFDDAFETPVIIIQYGLVAYSVHFLLGTINKVFNINYIGLLSVQLILLAPCVYLHFVASTILSEGISYPLCLILIALMFKMLINKDLRYVYKIAPILFVLILTRGQFIAAIPVVVLVALYVAFRQGLPLKKKIGTIGLILLVPILSGQTEKLYNKVVHGHAVNNAMNYVHLISASFYIAGQSDVAIFETEDEKNYFGLVHNSLEEAGLTAAQVKLAKKDDYQIYLANFPKICNARVHEIGLQYFKDKGLNYYQQNIALNALCSNMVFPLLRKNIKRWFVFYFKGLKSTFGTSKQMLLFLMLLICGLIYMFKTNKPLYQFMVLSTLFMFANNALIALAVHAEKRYLFYFDWVIFAIVIVFLNEVLKQKQLDES